MGIGVQTMIEKILAIITSRETQETLAERIRSNPKTSIVAVVCMGGWGGAATLMSTGFVIAGGLLFGATSLIAAVTLLVAGDK
jgi:hypothetical protein